MEAEVAWHYLLRLVDSLAVEQYLASSVVRLVLNMTDQSLQRRLAAIVVADVVGYSRLMEADEVATLADLRKLRSGVIEPAVMRYTGRIFKVMGDGFLIEFGSAVDAVAAALEMQRATTAVEAAGDRRLLLRVGVNLGDVIDDGSDVLGDGVNVAARLETLAAPGGICISAKVHGEIVGKIGDRFFDAGERYLKNLARPVHVWHWPDALQNILPLPECPSIAVLPFTNTSGDEADAPFVDGLTEDLITDLSRTTGLFVIARNSCTATRASRSTYGSSPRISASATSSRGAPDAQWVVSASMHN